MLDHISNMDQLESEAKAIDAYLQLSINDDPETCIKRGNVLVAYMARTGKMMADAKWHKDTALKSEIMQQLRDNGSAPASILNKLIDAACTRENYIFLWVERLNKTTTHQIDWLRTVVSKAKEERRTVGGVSGQPEQRGDYRAPEVPQKDYSPF